MYYGELENREYSVCMKLPSSSIASKIAQAGLNLFFGLYDRGRVDQI